MLNLNLVAQPLHDLFMPSHDVPPVSILSSLVSLLITLVFPLFICLKGVLMGVGGVGPSLPLLDKAAI